MSKNADEDQIKDRLEQLRCHFTWKLPIKESELTDLESRVFDEIEFLDTKFNVGIYHLLAYVRHLKGQNKEALESLKEAEDLQQPENPGQSDVRRLVTWGNYAWLYYHMGRLSEAQIYLDKVENTCKKFASVSCYSVECPEMDCEEGWALLKCGGKGYERAKACFEKALEAEPENPEFNTGYAIITFRLDRINETTEGPGTFSLDPLKRAVRLNPEDSYIKALLALKLQDVGQEAEGEKYIEEALNNASSQAYVFRYVAVFYRKKGFVDKCLQLLKMALQATPSSAFLHHQIGICYKSQMIQIKKAAKWQPRGRDRENVQRLVRSAMHEFEKALKIKPTFEMAYIDLAEMYAELGQYSKADDTFQILLSKGVSDDYLRHEVHYRYGRFQEYQMKSEDDAIIHYLKTIKIKMSSYRSNQSIGALEKLVSKKLRRNASDIESLSILGLLHKLKGEMNRALECYEQALRLAAASENSAGHSL
ncbi:interferon-induced protein with tetratricopeptide repeats 1B-like isoform X2 [Saccopteryx leptura]|uniref:interferon-induced protein with tetratricopeptide repeats 1B-like isoform X1 n=1 Tax=Saccopteryx leptura TaxID=249018 RepID=UPI00339C481D